MAKVEQLQCPSCGAREVSHISGINYHCDYCHSTFIVKNDNPNNGVNFNPPQPFDIKAASNKPIKIFVLITIIVSLMGVGISFFMVISSKETVNKSLSIFDNWQNWSVNNYSCLVGSKGAVVWLILKTQTNRLDSVKYQIRLIDPQTKKIISEHPLGKSMPWKELFNQSKIFDSDFYVDNDTIYNISEDGGIQGFGLYTGERLFGNEWFQNKFPQLKSGITKTEKQYYKKAVKISSANGDDFTYYLDSKQLLTKKEDEKKGNKESDLTENIYLTRTKKSELYLCTKRRRLNEGYYLEESYIKSFATNHSYYSDVKQIKKIGDAVFAMAVPIENYNNGLVLFYASDFSNQANGILALINNEGQFVWKNSDTIFKKIISDNTSDNIYLRFNLKNNLLVVNINNAGNQSVGINLETGKTLFVFNQSYNID